MGLSRWPVRMVNISLLPVKIELPDFGMRSWASRARSSNGRARTRSCSSLFVISTIIVERGSSIHSTRHRGADRAELFGNEYEGDIDVPSPSSRPPPHPPSRHRQPGRAAAPRRPFGRPGGRPRPWRGAEGGEGGKGRVGTRGLTHRTSDRILIVYTASSWRRHDHESSKVG